MSNQDILPSFSIIVAIHDQADDVEQNLPAMLTQNYSGSYNVVVVDEGSTDSTPDVLERLKTDYPHLYTTFLPKYHFQTNPRRMALTLGVKAARHKWVIFADAGSPPPSAEWLSELAEFAVSPSVLLLGYVNQKTGNVRLRPYDDIDQASKIITKTEQWRELKHGKWKMHLLSGSGYDFMVVRTDLGHEALKLFEHR